MPVRSCPQYNTDLISSRLIILISFRLISLHHISSHLVIASNLFQHRRGPSAGRSARTSPGDTAEMRGPPPGRLSSSASLQTLTATRDLPERRRRPSVHMSGLNDVSRRDVGRVARCSCVGEPPRSRASAASLPVGACQGVERNRPQTTVFVRNICQQAPHRDPPHGQLRPPAFSPVRTLQRLPGPARRCRGVVGVRGFCEDRYMVQRLSCPSGRSGVGGR